MDYMSVDTLLRFGGRRRANVDFAHDIDADFDVCQGTCSGSVGDEFKDIVPISAYGPGGPDIFHLQFVKDLCHKFDGEVHDAHPFSNSLCLAAANGPFELVTMFVGGSKGEFWGSL